MYIPIPVSLIILILILPGALVAWLYIKFSSHKYRKAKIQRRKKAEAIISGKITPKDNELLDLLTEILIDCKESKDTNASEAALQKNAELVKELICLSEKKAKNENI